MDLREFIEKNDVEYSKNTICDDRINELETAMGMTMGPELRKYIVEFGYLALGPIELYGVNSIQYQESDMVTQTLYLHKYFPRTEGLVALENAGEEDYYLVDTKDAVFEYIAETDELTDIGLSLSEFIVKRLSGEM